MSVRNYADLSSTVVTKYNCKDEVGSTQLYQITNKREHKVTNRAYNEVHVR